VHRDIANPQREYPTMVSNVYGAGSVGGYSAMSGASSRMPPQQKMSNLFDKIDTDNSGSITKSELGGAFKSQNPPKVFQNAGVDSVWSALDPNNTGSVNKADFVAGMKSLMVSLRRNGE
jgi:Ca2+-binding EF-hand superfamily protein